MALVEKSVLIERTAKQMYDLVECIEDYPKFLPWCGGSSVTSLEGDVVHASVQIDYHGLRQSFTTENARVAPYSIDMTLQDGPFQHLDGVWRFVPLSDAACKVEFRLHYEFSSQLLEKLVGPVFSHVANSFVDAFVKRAEKVYAGL